MMHSQEMDFQDEDKLSTDSRIVLLEGLSTPRASALVKNIARSNRNVHLPYLSHLDADRRIRLLLTERFHVRDGVSEVLGSLSTRKACLEQVHYARRAKQDTLSLVRLHLLTTYSFVRDSSVTATRWLDLIEAAFGDRVPGAIILLDHRCANGNFDLGVLGSSFGTKPLGGSLRDNEKAVRLAVEEADRRAEAMEALCSRFDIRSLYLPSGISSREDHRRVIAFMRTL